jgi:mannose-1-phosphate guanylyltransferase/mannose-6-phosphate isomerase
MLKIIPAIMSGGSGTRLWPLSTPQTPKQFHAIGQKQTLIQATAARFPKQYENIEFLPPIVIANERHGHLAYAQLAEIGVEPSVIALEPIGRNTAATALIAAHLCQQIDPDALTLLLPADHLIADVAGFLAVIALASQTARERIVTFGIEPTEPATGYGYIERGALCAPGVHEIVRFREKPSVDVARTLLEGGRHSWNAGIFLFSPATVRTEFRHAPEIAASVEATLASAARDGVFLNLPEALFVKTPALPFDIAVMEKTDCGAVAPCSIGWADIGAWDEVWRHSPQDDAGNALQGLAVCEDSRNCLVIADGVRVAVSGMTDIVVIATRAGILVLPRARAQEAKRLSELASRLE